MLSLVPYEVTQERVVFAVRDYDIGVGADFSQYVRPMMPDLLLDLFSEEIPARPFARSAAGARTNELARACGRRSTHA